MATGRCTGRRGSGRKVDFGGRKGFIRLALSKDVPIVPVVSIGGQETALFLSRGDRLARLLRIDKLLRLKVLPISLALPWGLNIGDMLGHLPLPAKITIQVLPPIDLREEFGPDPDLDEVYDDVVRRMQRDARRAGGGAAPAGDRLMRIEECISVAAPPERVWKLLDDPDAYTRFMAGVTRWRVEGRKRSGLGARYSMLMHVGSAQVGGLIEVVEHDAPRELAWTSVTGIDQRGRWRVREQEDGSTKVTLRLSYHAPGGPAGRAVGPAVGADRRGEHQGVAAAAPG